MLVYSVKTTRTASASDIVAMLRLVISDIQMYSIEEIISVFPYSETLEHCTLQTVSPHQAHDDNRARRYLSGNISMPTENVFTADSHK